MKQPFEIIVELHKDAEVGDLGHLTTNTGAYFVLGRNFTVPGIFIQLLDAQSNPFTVLVHLQNLGTNKIPFLYDLTRMNDFSRPGHIGHVKKTIDAVFDLNKCTVVRKVSNPTLDKFIDRVLGFDLCPGIDLNLLHAEGDLLLFFLDLEDHDLDLIPRRHDLVRMIDTLCPGHFRNVNEALDPVFELHKSSIGQHIDNLALDAGAHGILGFDIGPGALLFLLQAQRDTLLFLVDLEDLDLHFFIDLEQLPRVTDSPPAHVGDVEKAIDSPQIHKGTKVGDVLDDPTSDLTNFNVIEEFGFLSLTLLLEQLTARHHNIHASFVNLDDFALELPIDELSDITTTTNTDL